MTSVCTEPGCPNLRPCPTHGRKTSEGWSRNRNRTAQARMRQAVLLRDRYTCQRCGHHDPTGRTLEAAHKVPISRGGSYAPSNGETLCNAKANNCHRAMERA